ncbi:hypothetical protein C8J57DRAFT_1482616 [Mycena rebaudengoi]|nr:hypothetical protein C8J57DRAFT_1482616 [Mycena rebaudengoi]
MIPGEEANPSYLLWMVQTQFTCIYRVLEFACGKTTPGRQCVRFDSNIGRVFPPTYDSSWYRPSARCGGPGLWSMVKFERSTLSSLVPPTPVALGLKMAFYIPHKALAPCTQCRRAGMRCDKALPVCRVCQGSLRAHECSYVKTDIELRQDQFEVVVANMGESLASLQAFAATYIAPSTIAQNGQGVDLVAPAGLGVLRRFQTPPENLSSGLAMFLTLLNAFLDRRHICGFFLHPKHFRAAATDVLLAHYFLRAGRSEVSSRVGRAVALAMAAGLTHGAFPDGYCTRFTISGYLAMLEPFNSAAIPSMATVEAKALCLYRCAVSLHLEIASARCEVGPGSPADDAFSQLLYLIPRLQEQLHLLRHSTSWDSRFFCRALLHGAIIEIYAPFLNWDNRARSLSVQHSVDMLQCGSEAITTSQFANPLMGRLLSTACEVLLKELRLLSTIHSSSGTGEYQQKLLHCLHVGLEVMKYFSADSFLMGVQDGSKGTKYIAVVWKPPI